MGSHIEIIARGLITAGPHVLLCRSIKAGYRYLPGGHVEFGEAAADALAREIREECGLESKVGDLVLITEERFHDGKRERHELNLVFRAQLPPSIPGEPTSTPTPTPTPTPTQTPTPTPAASGGVFHVEHPHPHTHPQAASPASGKAVAPVPVRSQEPKIAFDWVPLADLAAADIRPPSIRRWLSNLRMGPSGQHEVPPLSWRT